jgi:3-phosphoinositide dependent protein kinase-1
LPPSSAGELYDQIRLRGRLSEPVAAFYAAEVVLMLEHLRSKALVHRDLKPENLLLDGDGHLKLIDFGSAKQLGPNEAAPTPPGIGGGEAVDGAAGAEDGVKGDEEAPDGEASSAGSTGTAEFDADAADPAELAVERSQSSSEGEDAADGAAAGGATGGLRRGGSAEPSKRTVSLVGTADYVSPEVGCSALPTRCCDCS